MISNRWLDMVDLRGKPPYLPPDMTYTDVLKHAIEKGLKFFGEHETVSSVSQVFLIRLRFRDLD